MEKLWNFFTKFELNKKNYVFNISTKSQAKLFFPFVVLFENFEAKTYLIGLKKGKMPSINMTENRFFKHQRYNIINLNHCTLMYIVPG